MASERVDVLSVVALRHELDPILEQGKGGRGGWTEAKDSTGATCFQREEINSLGQKMRICATWLGKMGQETATMRTRRLIDELSPACLASVGLIAGNRSAVQLGDVIIADRVLRLRPFPSGSEDAPSRHGEEAGTGDPEEAHELDLAWRTNAAALATDPDQLRDIGASRPPSLDTQAAWLLDALLDPAEPERTPPQHRSDRKRRCPDWALAVDRLLARAHVEITMTGVLSLTPSGRAAAQHARILHPDGMPEDTPLRIHLGSIGAVPEAPSRGNSQVDRADAPKILGVDIESAASLASIATELGLRWLVVRGVSDHGEATKDDRFRSFAASAATAVLFAFLTRYFDTGMRAAPPSDRSLGQHALSMLIERVEIVGFKNIEHLTLDFATESWLAGRWSCLAGINGSGKTTILQAVALILLGDKLSEQLGSVRLGKMVRRTKGSAERSEITATIRVGDEVMRLSLPFAEDGVDSDRLDQDPGVKEMRAFWEKRARRGILSAYGASRNLSEYIDNRHESLHLEVQRQMTLFDPLARVARAELLFSRGAKLLPVIATLRRILSTLLSDLPIAMSEDEEELRFRMDGADLPPSALPDGFRSTIAWLGDLAATWHEKAPPEEIGDGDPQRIHGIVLVDEVDLHLHPSLQRVLVPRLRQAMPRVQWIVTTHSPLVLASFDRHEIKMLDSTHPTGVRELDRDILGFTTDQIYDWLMDTKPRGVVLEEMLARAESAPLGSEHQRDLAALLATGPDFNAEDAQRRVAWRKDLLERIRQKV